MPPTVKLEQSKRFNDPNDKCKILVATDAIGMGLNLNIRRIVFYSLKKPMNSQNAAKGKTENQSNDFILTNNYNFCDDAKQISYINTSQALQIAGRAGRFVICGHIKFIKG